ncbi:MAG TPA: DHHA1 domain-containing protein [Pyrinomonadaceae bacterium]|nr:DHHA1 domain-containing protein [Pyrinomonadaceae bacterium]
MPVTERLYYNDSHLIEFEARVIEISERVSDWTAVTLDRTAFYPTGGGQPSDTGTINGLRVVECIDDEDNGVLHVIQGRPPEVGTTVKGRVDWLRRLDHMQQHTGQHILSQAFVTLFKAPTKGFRVLAECCEIDVELANPSNEVIERSVELANNVVWEDRQITIQTVSSQQATDLPLRKEPSREGDLRLIEIDGFDLTPCGGTHAFRTGEVGMIAVRHWERAKGLTRIEFVAGMRALADYRRANTTARAVAALFSSARDDGPALAARMLEEGKELHRRVRELEVRAAEIEADELLRVDESVSRLIEAANVSTPRIISRVYSNRSAESLKQLAHALISHENVVALLASQDEETARLVFARSNDAAGDMNALMREACTLLEGRGGGKPDFAQGGGKNVEKIQEALTLALKLLS